MQKQGDTLRKADILYLEDFGSEGVFFQINI